MPVPVPREQCRIMHIPLLSSPVLVMLLYGEDTNKKDGQDTAAMLPLDANENRR